MHIRFNPFIRFFLILIRILRGQKPQGEVGKQPTPHSKEGKQEKHTHEEGIHLEVLGDATAHATNLLVRLRQVKTFVVHCFMSLKVRRYNVFYKVSQCKGKQKYNTLQYIVLYFCKIIMKLVARHCIAGVGTPRSRGHRPEARRRRQYTDSGTDTIVTEVPPL